MQMNFLLIAKEGKVLQRLTEIGRCYGMEKNVGKTKVKKI
jgi:hypothetical protein